jgi:hypothetical protein
MQGTPMLDANGKTWAYHLQNHLYVLGRYETPTGGCDGIGTQKEVLAGIRKLAVLGSVLFEGFLISGLCTSYMKLEDELKPTHHWIWACLDTSLEKCIQQTLKRKSEKGRMKGFDPVNLTAKYHSVMTTRATLVKQGRDVRTLSHHHTLDSLLAWLVFNERPHSNPRQQR